MNKAMMTGDTGTSIPQRERYVPGELNRLAEAASMLRGRLDELAKRLGPVRHQVPRPKTPDGEQVRESIPEVAHKVRDIRDIVVACDTEVIELLDEIEV